MHQASTMGGTPSPRRGPNKVGSFRSLLQKERYHCQEGDALRAVHEYTEARKEYQSAISLRETLSGRYHLETEDLYFELFACNERLHDYDAQLEAERTSMSIHLYRHISLSGTSLDDYQERGDYCTIRSILVVHKGLNGKQVEDYIANHRKSVAYEKIGDIHRAVGNYDAAIAEYKKAISIEQEAIGRNGPTLSYLCRKVACISCFLAAAAAEACAIGRTKALPLHDRHVDWKMADKINTKWLNEVSSATSVRSRNIHNDTCAAITSGDESYHSQDFAAAILEYQWAARIKPIGSGGGDDGGKCAGSLNNLVIDEDGPANSTSRESTAVGTYDDESTINAVSTIIELLNGEFKKVHNHMDSLEEKMGSSCTVLRKRMNKKLDRVLNSMEFICDKVSSELDTIPAKDKSSKSLLTDEHSASRSSANDQHDLPTLESSWKCFDMSWAKCLCNDWTFPCNIRKMTKSTPSSDDTAAVPTVVPCSVPNCITGDHGWVDRPLEQHQSHRTTTTVSSSGRSWDLEKILKKVTTESQITNRP